MTAPPGARAVALLTAPPPQARAILAAARARLPDAQWTVCHRAADRSALGDALAGCETLELDAPRRALLRALRRQRFAVAAVAWTGHRGYGRMKLLGLLAAPRHAIYNENADWFKVGVRDRSWLRHLRWRAGLPRGAAPCAAWVACAAYRWTAGLLLGSALIAARCARARALRPRERG